MAASYIRLTINGERHSSYGGNTAHIRSVFSSMKRDLMEGDFISNGYLRNRLAHCVPGDVIVMEFVMKSRSRRVGETVKTIILKRIS